MQRKKTKPVVLKSVRKYQSSTRGIETRNNYVRRKKEIISEYNRKYQRELREKVKRIGFCATCKKRPGKVKRYLANDGTWKERVLTVCETCSELNKKRAKIWRDTK
jgi:RNase P subunit RPR2